MPEISLQPKQSLLLHEIKHGRASVIGVGGGRGSAKSSGGDRCVITLMYEWKGLLACVAMRNFDQVYKYHIEPIGRDFDWLDRSLKTSMPASLKIGKSQTDFSYAENMDDIVRRFRSGNYDLMILDQAEQFSPNEIRELRKAIRSKSGKIAKIVLIFNMRGAGIQGLRKWFYTKEYNKDEDPRDYTFIKMNPWDNVQWVISALGEDGYSVEDYYRWTDEQRKSYAALRGPYTKQLATDDEVIRQADWEGDWNSLEGAYFANSFDLESLRIDPGLVEVMRKPWATHWIGQDWGKAHFCVTYWNYRVTLSPSETEKYLGWTVRNPLNVVVTYREMIVSEQTSVEVARHIVANTPQSDRNKLKAFYLSPDAFGERDSINTIASQQAKETRSHGIPGPIHADNDRQGGWMLMAKLMRGSKFKGIDLDSGEQVSDVWLISCECVELLKAIPMLMRDPKNLDDVLKTDKGQAKIEQDVADAIRYSLKSMLSPKKKTAEDNYQEQMVAAEPVRRMMLAYKHEMRKNMRKRVTLLPSWKGNLR